MAIRFSNGFGVGASNNGGGGGGGNFTYTQMPGGIGQYTQGVSVQSYSPFGPGNSAYAFNGSDGFIEIYPGADTALGNGDYTIEWFYLHLGTNSHGRFFSIGHYPTAMMDCSYEGAWWFGENGGWVNGGPSMSLSIGNWYHMAIVRINGTTSMYNTYVDNGSETGQLVTSFADGNNLNDTTTPLRISQDNLATDPGCYLNGAITNFRWVKGLGVYTQAGFKVPTSNLTATASANPYGGDYTEAISAGYTKFLLVP